jgi:DNA polymerase-3 subunit epsilon
MNELHAIQHFTAIDIELSNNEQCSICEIGLAKFRAGNLVETWRALVDPECEYEPIYHSDLHGIRKQHTAEAPTFPEVYSVLERFLDGEVCIYHADSEFDPACIQNACDRYELPDVTRAADWLSTLHLSREHWPDSPSHKLMNLAESIGHDYVPHNALEDAIACAAIFRALSGASSVPGIAAAGNTTDRPRTFRRVSTRKRSTGLKGDPSGKFAGIFMVFTGAFSPPWDDRPAFEEYLCSLGFTPRGGITGKTEFLVIGDEPGPSKIRKAEERGIPIFSEDEFKEFIKD